MRTGAWLLATVLAAFALLAWTPARDAFLLQSEAGGPLLFGAHLGLALAATAAAVFGPRLARRLPLAASFSGFRPDAFAWLLVVAVIGLEALLDPALTRLLARDFTAIMPALEGRAVAGIQSALRTPSLDVAFTALYAYGYLFAYGLLPAMLILRRDRLVRPLLRTIVLAWCIGLPAYLLIPVNEPWAVGYAHPVMHDTIPPVATNDLVAASINNELPSMHSLLSVAVAATVFLERRRALAWTLVPFAVGIPVATVYLGVHWLTDAATGALLGALCARASRHPAWLGRWLPSDGHATAAVANPKAEKTPTR